MMRQSRIWQEFLNVEMLNAETQPSDTRWFFVEVEPFFEIATQRLELVDVLLLMTNFELEKDETMQS
jgi:hypothetical protein